MYNSKAESETYFFNKRLISAKEAAKKEKIRMWHLKTDRLAAFTIL